MKSGVFTQGLRHLFVASIGIVALVGSGAKADQFQVTIDSGVSTISGSIGATTFTNATWSMSGIIDTANGFVIPGVLEVYVVAPTLNIYSGSSTHVYDFQAPTGSDYYIGILEDKSHRTVIFATLEDGDVSTRISVFGTFSLSSLRTPGTYSAATSSFTGSYFTTAGALTISSVKNQDVLLTVSSYPPSAVPEPAEWAGLAMLGSGLGGLVVRARRRKVTA